MRLSTVNIGQYAIKYAPHGWAKLQLHGTTIGYLEPDKLLDDLPRVIGRRLTAEEQNLLSNNIPRCVA
jgi:hypothetical protein